MQVPAFAASFTDFDYFLLILVLLSTLQAFVRGFIRTALSLVGFVAGILIASWEYLPLAQKLGAWIQNFAVAEVIAFLLILVLVIVLVSLIAQVLRTTVKAIGLGLLDRLLGAGFGAVRGMLIGVALLMALSAFAPATQWAKNSQLAPYFLAGFHEVSFIVPQHFQDQIAAGAKYILHEAPGLVRQHTPTEHM